MRTPTAVKPWAEELRYLFFGCALPAGLFGLLGWYNLSVLRDLVSGPGRPGSLAGWVAGPFERALYLAFVSIPVVIYVSRPRARRRAGGFAPAWPRSSAPPCSWPSRPTSTTVPAS